MHTILTLSSLLAASLGGSLALRLQSRLACWSHHRIVQLVTLTLPLVGLGISLCGVYHFVWRVCLGPVCSFTTPSWDRVLDSGLALGMVTMTVGALIWGAIRCLLLAWVMAGTAGTEEKPELRVLIRTCAERLQVPQPAIQLVSSEQPLAWTSGWFRPRVLISTWMVEHLDRRELEAVLMHEVVHVARRDAFILWLGRVLRDAFWYLPTSREAYHLLQQEKELACDDLVVEVTRRPLALASALTKVWLRAADGVSSAICSTVQPLVGTNGGIEARIERLLAVSTSSTGPARRTTLAANALVLDVLEMITLTVPLVLIACGPVLLLLQWR